MDNDLLNRTSDPVDQSAISKIRPAYGRIALFLLKWTIAVFVGSTLLTEIVFSFMNPPLTPLMIDRVLARKREGKHPAIERKWVPLNEISQNMVNAVVASEDNRFLEHWGIDVEAIEKAVTYNKHHRRKHGASTITQQVAKNVFLWPARTWLRKGFELYFTVTIELIWSKRRIMEVYLNVIETGDGIYGVEAASQKYFHIPARKLNSGQAALIAASLPNPRVRNPASPSSYMLRRQAVIMDLMGKIGDVKFK